MLFQDESKTHVLQINKKIFKLDFLYLSELTADNALLSTQTDDFNISPAVNKTEAEKLIKDSISFSETAFKLFGSETELNNRLSEILHQYDCFPPLELTAAAADINYETLTDFEPFPGSEMQEYIEKRVYLPSFGEEETDPYFFENDHLTADQTSFLKNIINDHKEAISTNSDPLGNFNLFQVSINLFPGKSAHQVKRNIDFDLISNDIARMERLGIISENFSTDIPTLSNLVIVSKASRLCKADRFVKKKAGKIK